MKYPALLLLAFLLLSSCKKETAEKIYNVKYNIGCTDCEVIYYKDAQQNQQTESSRKCRTIRQNCKLEVHTMRTSVMSNGPEERLDRRDFGDSPAAYISQRRTAAKGGRRLAARDSRRLCRQRSDAGVDGPSERSGHTAR